MSAIIIFFPLISFLISGLGGFYVNVSNNKKLLQLGFWFISCLLVLFASIASVFMFIATQSVDYPLVYNGFNWIVSGNLYINFVLHFDVLTAIMCFTVTFISLLVHIYSYFYMSKDDNLAKFIAYLSLFTFSMLLLIVSDNLLQMFIGWELISLCSYLLISFYSNKDSATYASEKGFLVNRFADIAFILAIFACFLLFSTLNIADISKVIQMSKDASFTVFNTEISLLSTIAFLFVFAAFAKSAQLILHIWLPDAMEAPTPVSALLHAATMVTAGVFLLVKISPILEYTPVVNDAILIISAVTAVYGALVACFQRDIKKIIAFSTISQLGYMFLAVGVGFYNGAIFHLFTHAFFKALLFLAAGSVIHAMSGEQDIYRMGNIWRKTPLTYVCMLIGSLSLIGIPGFSGFYSKEIILNVLYQSQGNGFSLFAFYMGIATIFFTALYSFKLLFVVFHGEKNYSDDITPHESSAGMILVMAILSVGAIIVGYLQVNNFVGKGSVVFWNNSIKLFPDNIINNEDITFIALGLIIFALICSYVLFIKANSLRFKLINTFSGFSNACYNKLYIDYIYDVLILRFIHKLGGFLELLNDKIIDMLCVNSIAAFFIRSSKTVTKLQTGSISFYAIVMLLGFLVILTYCILIFWGIA